MAKMEIKGIDELALKVSQLGKDTPKIAKKMVRAGANPVADEIRKRLENLPSDTFRKLSSDEIFTGVPEVQKKDLTASLGVTPVDIDYNGITNVKVGFAGYGSYPTKKYPKGVPNPLLARAIESGSSVRKKTPFVRPAVNKSKKIALTEMQKAFDEEVTIYAL